MQTKVCRFFQVLCQSSTILNEDLYVLPKAGPDPYLGPYQVCIQTLINRRTM